MRDGGPVERVARRVVVEAVVHPAGDGGVVVAEQRDLGALADEVAALVHARAVARRRRRGRCTRSGRSRSSAASASVSASRFEWMSERMPMRMRGLPAGRARMVAAAGERRQPARRAVEEVDLEVVEVGEPPGLGVTGADLLGRERAQPVERELLDREAREHARRARSRGAAAAWSSRRAARGSP